MIFKLFESLIFILFTFLIVLSIQNYITFERKMLNLIKIKERNLENLELYSNYLFSGLDGDSSSLTTTIEILDTNESKILKYLKLDVGRKEIEILVLDLNSP